jgi:hypothetical protein
MEPAELTGVLQSQLKEDAGRIFSEYQRTLYVISERNRVSILTLQDDL